MEKEVELMTDFEIQNEIKELERDRNNYRLLSYQEHRLNLLENELNKRKIK